MQSVSSRIWTPIAVSISYDDNHYTTGTSKEKKKIYYYLGWLVGWFLWYTNLCRLFNSKSIFIQIISSILNNSV